MKKMTGQLALALAVLSLAGCGLKGPLYFPDNKTSQPRATSPIQSGSSDSSAAASTGQDVQSVR